MRVCSNCFAEGIDEEICPFCGQFATQKPLPSIISLKTDHVPKHISKHVDNNIEAITNHDDEKNRNKTSISFAPIQELYVGQHIHNRYTIQRDFGIQENWLFYQAVDHLQGRECIIKVEIEKDEHSLQLPFFINSPHPALLAPTIIQKEPKLIFAIPVRTQVFRPVWRLLSEQRKLEILMELVEAIDIAHDCNLADIELYPTKEWLYQVQVCSDDAQHFCDPPSIQKDFQRVALFATEIMCNAFDLTEIPQNLSPMSIRMARWTRHMWKGERWKDMKEALYTLKQVFGGTGVYIYEPIVQEELEIRSYDGALLMGSDIIRNQPSLKILSRGNAIATHRLWRGRILLQSTPMLMTEAGIQPPKPDDLSLWLYLDVVRQEPQIDNLKISPAKNIEEQIERARLALWFQDMKQAQLRFGACLQNAKTTQDWLAIARCICCDLKDSGETLYNALKKAEEASQSLEDEYRRATFYRWRLNDIRKAKRICKHAKRRVLNIVDLFGWYETQISLFDFDIETAIVNIWEHTITQDTELQEICIIFEQGLDRFGMHDIWVSIIRKLEEKIKRLPEYELVLMLYSKMGIRELYFALLEKLDEKRHEIAQKAAWFHIPITQYDLPYLQMISQQILQQEDLMNKITDIKMVAQELGITLTWPKPFRMEDILAKELLLTQLKESKEAYQQLQQKTKTLQVQEQEPLSEIPSQKDTESITEAQLVVEDTTQIEYPTTIEQISNIDIPSLEEHVYPISEIPSTKTITTINPSLSSQMQQQEQLANPEEKTFDAEESKVEETKVKETKTEETKTEETKVEETKVEETKVEKTSKTNRWFWGIALVFIVLLVLWLLVL